jgi:trimeric autotransporter adhesin
MEMRRIKKAMLALAGCAVLAAPLQAAVVPKGSPVRDKEYRNPALYVPSMHTPLSALKSQALAAQLQQELASLNVSESGAFYDVASDRWGSLLPSEPLVPGTGVGNRLEDTNVSGDETAFRQRVWSALTAWLQRHEAVLRVDIDELARPNMNVSDGGELVQIVAPRRVNGVIVRDGTMVAVVNHGNLVLIGFQNWAPATLVPTDPALSADQAKGVAAAHVSPAVFTADGKKARRAHLELVPLAREKGGYEFRLAWVVVGKVEGDLGTWEALVDAGSGELLSFADVNQYALKKVVGGVYPVSNDGQAPDGIEIPGTSMPFADITFPGGVLDFANSSGVLGCGANPGPGGGGGPGNQFLRTSLSGRFVEMRDDCGPVNEKSLFNSELNFDLGSGPGTDCQVPPGHSPGDTHASRSGFYELNRLIEQAKGYLPTNTWLQGQLPANMNIPDTCNAFWDGSSVNFFRSGGGCRNTGEIAAIFDHEWGHGMDNNGVNPNIASPGEAIADIHSILRLQDSCLGRGTLIGQNCGGYGDACTQCSGFRDLDFARHVSGQPHNITNFIATNCAAAGQRGPCNRETHCEGQIVAEAGWDLQARDLRAAPFNFDSNTALELSTRTFFLASQPVTQWYQCSGTPPTGDGCNALHGYLNALSVDDDNGNINDGTPHMTALFAAFNRHQIACNTPTVVNSGCVGGPVTPPVVTATPGDQGGTLSWPAVPGATRYAVYRTEGPRGCNFGKVKVGETTTLSFRDSDLSNGNTYFYSVLPIGAAASCFGPMSSCTSMVPVPGSNLRTLNAPAIQVLGGDNDGVLDNCETARLRVTAENTGITQLTNVRVVSVVSSSHPLTTVTTPLPATLSASLAACGQAAGNIDVVPHGMAFNDTFRVTVTVTADQIFPATRSLTFTVGNVEGDFATVATRTYNFNTDFQGWTTSGTFTRVDGGGGNFFLASSNCLDDQCDIASSPVVRLTNTSTLSLVQRYDTETPTPIPYDRANVGVLTLDNNVRTAVSPSGGDLYDLAPGAPNGACGTLEQAGWSADTDDNCTADAGFVSSSWTSAALNPGNGFSGRQARISVHYGTDPAAFGFGFHFDDVVLTNFQEQIPDAQSCTLAPVGTSTKPTAPKALNPTRRAAKRK